MRLRLYKLQAKDKQARKLRANQQLGQQGWDNINGVLHYQSLPYVPEIIQTELISRHYDNPLAGHFGIEKMHKLIARKYYWPTFRHNVEDYVKRYNICLTSKAVRHKPYGDLQSLQVPIHRWKDLLIDFVTDLPVLTDWRGDSYDSILVNFEQNDWARLLPMAEFAYNNAKNASIGYTPFKLNCRYHPRIFYEEEEILDLCFKSKTVEKLFSKLQELMIVCQQNLYHAQELQKQAHNKGVKPRSYAPGDKVWLSSKHLKTKENYKLEAKFLGPF